MICQSYFKFFETVSGKMRWKILLELQKSQKSVSELSTTLKEEQSKVSHNLRNLLGCHFIDVKREGKKRIYSLNKDTILPLMKLVKDHVHKYCTRGCKKQ